MVENSVWDEFVNRRTNRANSYNARLQVREKRVEYLTHYVFINMQAKERYEQGKRYFDEENLKEAIKCFRIAARQNYLPAQYDLAVCYANAWGTVQKYAKTIYWLTRSANQGYAPSQCDLGACYFRGCGVKHSYCEAVKWYRLAAEQGYDSAQYNLAYCYHHGHGVEQDYRKAVELYKLAAEQGNKYAKRALKWLSIILYDEPS